MSGTPVNPQTASKASTRAVEWKGTSRYEVTRCIGEGGMGVVYEAFDRERRQKVALKTLLHFSPAGLYRFKQEFRTLADVTHGNLVHLYELVATEAEGVFFTMELVDGTDFLTYTRRPDAEGFATDSDSTSSLVAGDDDKTVNEREATRERVEAAEALSSGPESGVLQRTSGRPPRASSRPPKLRMCPADIERLRLSLRQLVEGVQALHAAGRLHRDIKPSNVLVTQAGRVVLLDFGVATELGAVVDEKLVEREVVGTVRYMAPEQATDDALGFASDWYSVGAMLYEALVGQPPFIGPRLDVVTRKAMLDPRPPRDCVEGVPADLDALCCDLLRRNPLDRPTGAQVLRRLGVRTDRARTPVPPAPGVTPAPLVGRETHMRDLRLALEDAKSGRAVTVLVHGASGMGKTALVEQFLDGLIAGGEAVALRGRAYERESVPYKAFDSIVDALSRYLMRLSDDDGTVTMPADIWALARLFPVLRRVAPIAATLEPAAADPQYVRRHAFAALRSLLGELARRRPLVVWIDDVQWGDVDSVNLLFEMVRAPLAPPLLVVMTYRDEDGDSSPFILEMHARWPVPSEVRDLPVGPLAADDARTLARTLLSAKGPAPLDVADAIARESGGSAFLIEELVRTFVARREREGAGAASSGLVAITLANMVGERLAVLDSTARKLVEVIVVCGRPVELTLAGDAAGVFERVDETVEALRARGFVRTGYRAGRETVEMCHDGIRETLLAQLPEDVLRAHHSRLARVFESASVPDAEAISVHLFGAGEAQRAAEYAEQAAEQAATKLAFDQAIRLYRRAIEAVDAPEVLRRLRSRLGEVLEGAGRGPEAADCYLAAAEGAQAFDQMELRRRAAEQLIASGHIDDGIRMMRGVFDAVGLRMPRTGLGALFWISVYGVWSWVRGWSFEERDPEVISPLDRAQIDATHAASVTMVFIDAILALYTTALHLNLALRRGDRYRVLRALSMHTVGIASRGGPESPRERVLAEAARSLAKRTRETDAWTYVDIIRALCMFLHGRWKDLISLEADLLVALPHNRGGWRNQVRTTAIWALVLTGDVAHVRRSIATLIEDAENRGDLGTAVHLRVGYTNLVWLADDDIDGARAQLVTAVGMWSHSKFFLHNYRVLLAEANIELYAGNSARAHEIVVARWGQMQRSLMLFVQYIRADAYYLRARTALASAESSPRPAARLAEAERFARKLDRQKMPWTDLLAHCVWAGVRLAKGDRVKAAEHLRAAIARAEEVGMALHGAAARYALGLLLGDAEGRRLVEGAEDWMLSEDIRVPKRMAALLIPGKWAGAGAQATGPTRPRSAVVSPRAS
jgi:serine/threonine protein kinase